MARKLKHNLAGQKFGMVTPFEHVGNGFWKCKCDCGKIFIYQGSKIHEGLKKSCGCMKGFKGIYTGCDDDCFNCKYPDCAKPDYLCDSKGVKYHGCEKG